MKALLNVALAVAMTTVLYQTKDGNLNVRVKEHYGDHTVYTNLLLVSEDDYCFYLGKKFDRPIVIPKARWAIDSVWTD
jgi:hypothetical protein